MSLLTYFRVLMLPVGRNCYWKLSVELIVILLAELELYATRHGFLVSICSFTVQELIKRFEIW